MLPTRKELDLALDALAAATPRLMVSTLKANQPDLFNGMADDLFESAHPNDKSHVWSRLQRIQREAGLIPGDGRDFCADSMSSQDEGTGGPG